MSDWKAGDWAMVEIAEIDGYIARIRWGNVGSAGWTPLGSLHPLPQTLSAEDAAVLDLATRLCALLVGRPPAIGPAVETARQLQFTLNAVRARAAKAEGEDAPYVGHPDRAWPGDGAFQPPCFPDCEPSPNDRIAAAAIAWRRSEPALPPTAYQGLFGVLVREIEGVMKAMEPPDPRAELQAAAEEILRLEAQAVECGADVAGPVRRALDRLRAALAALAEKSA